MKKLTLLFTAVALIGPNGVRECLADYGDIASQVDTVANFWLGGTYNDTDSSVNYSFAERQKLPETADRVGTNKASEYYALKNSPSGGVLLAGAPLPNRYHVELDYYNDSDWFGDVRYSYKDYLQLRLLPRRFTHNLDNLTIYDFNPAVANFTPPATYNTNGNDVDILDEGIDDYRLRVDIDEYKLRLKTPNYPMHLYANGEVVSKKGMRQARFLGGNGGRTGNRGQVRATDAREVDQETQTLVVGTNAHVGPVEFDLSHKSREFESNLADPTHAYDFGTRVLQVVPELKATTNTIKLHTSHTGRIFASGTYSETEKKNEYSNAKAEIKFGYGEVSWVPAAYLSVAAKFRHQKNEAKAPTSVSSYNRSNVLTSYPVAPGVESQTDTAILSLRYSMIPKSSVSLQYTHQRKDVDGESAVEWSRPQDTTKDVYEFGFNNWAIPSVRTTAKLVHTAINNNYGDTLAGYEPAAIDPEHINQGSLGVTWLISPKVTAFVNASAAREESHDNRMNGGITNANKAEALNEHYMMSLNFALSEKFSISPSYTYMSWKQKRDIVWEYQHEVADPDGTTTGDVTTTEHIVDTEYTSKQTAQNFALSIMTKPAKRLNINGLIEYTITKGNYNPTSPVTLYSRVNDGVVADVPFNFFTDVIAEFSRTDTREWNIRLDSEYDLGRGWGVGLDLRFVDWEDTSGDNPSDGIFYGGLFKVSKKLFY